MAQPKVTYRRNAGRSVTFARERVGGQSSRRPATFPLHAYFIVSAVFHYLGPSFAVLLFTRVEVLGVCSSVIPYVADQLAMTRLSRATYSLMVSLLPATAAVMGLVVLAQVPTAAELMGIALVVGGVAVHRDPA